MIEALQERKQIIITRAVTKVMSAIAQQRTADLSLYRQFRTDETFRHDFANLVRAAIENADHIGGMMYGRAEGRGGRIAAEG